MVLNDRVKLITLLNTFRYYIIVPASPLVVSNIVFGAGASPHLAPPHPPHPHLSLLFLFLLSILISVPSGCTSFNFWYQFTDSANSSYLFAKVNTGGIQVRFLSEKRKERRGSNFVTRHMIGIYLPHPLQILGIFTI